MTAPATSRKTWQFGSYCFDLCERPLVMGILNATPDSFYDGGEHLDHDLAVSAVMSMVEQGADIIDIGGESSRPGAAPVTAEEERQRVIPIIQTLRRQTDCPLSIDTTKAAVAREALAAGADIINDISGFEADPGMVGVAAESGAGCVIMHRQGTPEVMQDAPRYDDVVHEVGTYLRQRVAALRGAGIQASSLVLDPGIGFGKTLEHNLALIRELRQLADGYPILVGLSRKSFIGLITGAEPAERLPASLAAHAAAIMYGADIIRVHDVKESCEVVRIMATLRKTEQA